MFTAPKYTPITYNNTVYMLTMCHPTNFNVCWLVLWGKRESQDLNVYTYNTHTHTILANRPGISGTVPETDLHPTVPETFKILLEIIHVASA